MITKKEFYFVRHGQTDYNLKGVYSDSSEICLNETGKSQALAIEPIVRKLPIKTICFSPLIRARETKDLISVNLASPQVEIEGLAECHPEVWKTMANLNFSTAVMQFVERARHAVNLALSQEGPVLIVAHGGIHFAICSLMKVKHDWKIDNCVPVHFQLDEKDNWSARKLVQP